MLSKFKTYLFGGIAFIAAMFVMLFSREKRKRKQAEAKFGRQKAITAAQESVNDVQSEINAVIQKTLRVPKKNLKKPEKILLPVILCFLFISCGRVEYVYVMSSPELFTFETGVELELHDNMYCTDEDGALKIQNVLNAYRDEIESYNQWRGTLK